MVKRKKNIAQLFSFLSMGFSLLSIPFYFLGMFVRGEKSEVLEDEKYISVTGFFKLTQYDGEEYKKFTAVIVLIIVALAVTLLISVFSVFKNKAMKIVSFATVCSVLLADILICVFAYKYARQDEVALELKLGYGMILIFLLMGISFACALSAFIIFLTVKEKVQKVDGYVNYDIPMDVIGASTERVSLGNAGAAGVQPEIVSKGSISIVSGSCKGFSIPVSDGETVVIGKDPQQCAVIIDKKYTGVSRRHCEISFDSMEDAYLVKDCSQNGTFMENGTRLANGIVQRLPRNTIISLAKTENIIRLD